ncbi:MAG: hypothetical protein ABSA13_03440 [Beijerinckiaceae bacterium]
MILYGRLNKKIDRRRIDRQHLVVNKDSTKMTISHHLANRQNVLQAPLIELEARLEAVAASFHDEWLSAGVHPMQILWSRRDVLATNQLIWFGDAILNMRAIDTSWTQRELSKVKSQPANVRKGAAFELLGLNMLSQHQRVVPTAAGTPGYDGIAYLPDGGRMALSLKNYGTSTHEQVVQQHGAALETILTNVLRTLGKNGVDLRVIARQNPSSADWERLKTCLPEIIASDPQIPGNAYQDTNWTVIVRRLAGVDARPSASLSYQITILAPLHANEHQNLISKLDEASANAERHARGEADLCHAVMVHLPENASLDGCNQWAQTYFAERPDGPIDLVILYQPSVASLNGSQASAIVHAMQCVEGPRYNTWSKPHGGKRRRVGISFYVGIVSGSSSRLILKNDLGQSLAGDQWYLFQSGHLYQVVEPGPNGVVDIKLSNPAPGLFRHALGPDGTELRGIFPPSSDLLIFT